MYAVKQDLIDRFGSDELAQLTDRVNGTVIDDAVVNRALADADSEINGYLQSRYTLPLTSTPPVLTKIACDIARYQLFEDRATEAVIKRYDDAVRWLKDVAAGKVSLGLDAANEETTTESGTVDYKANDRVFDKGTLADY